ncbi:MAG: Ig-like domain-containing protein [Candidatus Kapabacteria bacterium]|nr:Ig-like domain-containing protein [Candidatus Kapabacteria bacterium]
MKNFRIVSLIVFLTILSLINFSGCANPMPPSGGPRDTIPPKIKDYFPKSGLTNYKESYVKIKFDKYMNKNSVQQNTTIIPSLDADFDWSGRELRINFLDKPKENTTYSISLGTEIQDWKGNKPNESFTIIFSTGDVIDSGKISGQLISPNPTGASIFLYKLPFDSLNTKYLDITKEKPNYNIQVGSSGLFEIKALKDGYYRLISVRDIFRNGIYDDGQDEFGAYTEDIYVKQDSVVNVKIKLGPVIDKLGPILYDVNPIGNKILEANFSEPLDTNFLFTNAFAVSNLTDTIGKEEIIPSSVIFPPDSRFKLLIYLNDKLDTSKKYVFKCKLDRELAIRDTIGNIIRDTANSIVFQPISKDLKSLPALISGPLKDSSQNVFPMREFEFVFNIPLKRLSYISSFQLINLSDSSAENINIKFKTDNIIIVKTERKLLSDVWYELSVRTDSIYSFENIKMPDSTFSFRFKTADIRGYSGLNGSLKSNFICNGDFYVIIKNQLTKTIYKTKANNKLQWSFDDLPPGDYEFEVFCDEDGDGKYSYGNAVEFRFSEKFFILKDKVTLKSRWKVENYQLEIKE